MTTPLLTTKLYIPPPRPDLVPRGRLIRRLDEGLRLKRKLALLSAPAGFGKTTLLSEWAASCGRPVAWLALDEGDNDPARFWSYVAAALRTIPGLRESGVGESALVAFDAPQPPAIEAVLTGLINEIAAAAEPLCLVLDDYHLITARPVHDALAFLLDHLPAHVHLVIASRADPPLPLALWRGRGQVTEVRAADLRFTPDEAAAFLHQVAGLALSEEDVVALERRTEGWITGLQLAALSMRDREDVSGFIQAFTGSNRYVLDYLTEEVLQRQPDPVQAFLLQTSILERLRGDLCDAILRDQAAPEPTDEPTQPTNSPICRFADLPTFQFADSQEILEYLESANLFIVPLDEERRWYRYHRLFADLLRARVEEAQPRRVAELHRRASAWFEEQDMLEEAVTHAVAAGDLARVEGLIERHGMPTLMRGELITLLRWIAALPEERVLNNARVCVLHAWALLLTGQGRPVEPRLTQAEQRLRAAPDDDLAGEIAAIRAYLTAQRGDVAGAVELARQALDLLDPENLGIRGVVYFVLGGSHLLREEIAAASEAIARASAVGRRGGNIHVAVPALNALAGIQALQGHLHQARATAREAVRLATGSTDRPLPIAGGALSALAELAYERNETKAALAHAREGIELGRRWGNAESLGHSYLTLTEILVGGGDLAGAREALREAERTSRDLEPNPLLTQLRAGWARLWLAQGDLRAAEAWAEGIQEATLDRLSALGAGEALALARVRLALGQPDAALKVLGPVLELARTRHLNGILVEALALQSLALQSREAVETALETLEEALALARPEGYVRRFVDLGPAMARLLSAYARRAAGDDALRTYADELLRAIAEIEPARAGAPLPPSSDQESAPIEPVRSKARSPRSAVTPSPAREAALIEPLSPRELEVLAQVAEGLPNREVARRLYIAESTVKSHLNAVYGKLEVRNRTQAVAKARALGLLE